MTFTEAGHRGVGGGNQDVLALLFGRFHVVMVKTATAYQPPTGHTSRSEVSRRQGFSQLQRNSDSAVSGWSRYFTHTQQEKATLGAEDGADLCTVRDGVSLLGAEVAQDVRRLPLTRVVNPRTSYREKPYHIFRPVSESSDRGPCTHRQCTSKQQPPEIIPLYG